MSQFFNKMKQGVSDAGKKAHNTVESATLKMQISSKEKEIDKNYTDIGRIVHQSIARKESMIPINKLQKNQQIILKLEKEIEHMQRKVQQIQSQKECGCGKMLPADATYCPFCGQQFHTVKVKSVPLQGSKSSNIIHCVQCGTSVSTIDHFCRSCGYQLKMS